MKEQNSARTFKKGNLLQISMPMGGIGAGNICLNGYGGIQDFGIRHSPLLTALPDRHSFTEAAFGLLHVKGGRTATRLVEGPFPPEKIYDQGLQGQGYRHGGFEGLPRFEDATFHSEYPFGRVELKDKKMPVEVVVTGFNPFIPRDDKNSGIPCAILEYTFKNVSGHEVNFDFSYHLSHLSVLNPHQKGGTKALAARGVFFDSAEDAGSEGYGTACLLSLNQKVSVKGAWFLGGWFDAVSVLWRECSAGRFQANGGCRNVELGSKVLRLGGSILFSSKLKSGQRVTLPLVIAWHFPNCGMHVGGCCDDRRKQDGNCCAQVKKVWHPFYSEFWENAQDVAEYVRAHYTSLRKRTLDFKKALFSSTLPAAVLDAVSSNLAILKSSTVLRQANGNLWGWEGCFPNEGCCHGSCTHVWNYAQSLCHLFPQLERTLREQELLRSMSEDGHVTFRAALPDGAVNHDFHAAADGQFGGILKLYRDWQISGDTEWMKRMYPYARKSLEYCIHKWDPQKTGALLEPHHNTYDIEFWGADGMCTSIYLGALHAMGKMAIAAGKNTEAEAYENLAQKAARYMDEKLFNGEYYFQKVQYKGLKDRSFLEQIKSCEDKEVLQLLKKEGPKYQYGTGCLSDGIIGGWMAELYGVETALNRANVKSALKAIFKYNFKRDLAGHANTQRPGYAMGNEGGLLVCSWPKRDKPTLPFPYSDEIFTGIEYQVASHLIMNGGVKEGVEIVRAVRKRHDGKVRNPFNEYECGNYYARAMSSYSLLAALSGFRYSAEAKALNIAPVIKKGKFKVFFSTASSYGTVALDGRNLEIHIIEGVLDIQTIEITLNRNKIKISKNLVIRQGKSYKLKF